MAAKKKLEATVTEGTQDVVIPLPKTLHRELRFLSIDRDRPMNALLLEAIRGWWEKQPEHGSYPHAADAPKKPKPQKGRTAR